MNSLKKMPEFERLAKKYIWWESVKWAEEHPIVFLANVMNLGVWDDILLMRKYFGDVALREVLLKAPPGYFSYRSWDFWHHKLDVLPIPPLP